MACVLLASFFMLTACQPLRPVPGEIRVVRPMPNLAVDDPLAGATTYVFEVDDEAITAPETVPNGPASVKFTNSATTPQVLETIWVDAGTTVEEGMAAVPLGIAGKTGTFNIVFLQPGQSIEALLDFSTYEAYAIYRNFSEDADTVAFVTGDEAALPGRPLTGVGLSMADFSFLMPEKVSAGPLWWEITNGGSQTHEVSLFKLSDELTAEMIFERLAAVDAAGQMPPTVEEIPGWGLGAGLVAHVRWDLEPGRYLILCRVPDWRTMPPGVDHWHLGMTREFEVVK